MVNLLYDFNASGNFVPYIGAGAGIGFIDSRCTTGCTMCTTQFAYPGHPGRRLQLEPQPSAFNLEGRYYRRPPIRRSPAR